MPQDTNRAFCFCLKGEIERAGGHADDVACNPRTAGLKIAASGARSFQIEELMTQAGSDSKHAAVGIGLEITSGLARFELDVYATQNGLYSEPTISVSFGASLEF